MKEFLGSLILLASLSANANTATPCQEALQNLEDAAQRAGYNMGIVNQIETFQMFDLLKDSAKAEAQAERDSRLEKQKDLDVEMAKAGQEAERKCDLQ